MSQFSMSSNSNSFIIETDMIYQKLHTLFLLKINEISITVELTKI